MEDILDIEAFAEQLQDAFVRAAAVDMPGLTVTMRVPFGSNYAFVDDSGARFGVFLPTRTFVRPAEFDYELEPANDGGPAVTYTLRAEGEVPDLSACRDVARELYARAIAWGCSVYGVPEVADERPAVPVVLDDVVLEAFGVAR